MWTVYRSKGVELGFCVPPGWGHAHPVRARDASKAKDATLVIIDATIDIWRFYWRENNI